jgi:rod shape-determining protein MreC
MFKRPYYIALALVALLTLLVLNLPGSTTARLKLAIGSIFLPLFGATGAAQQAAAKAGDTLLPKSELIRANEILRRQNQELRFQAMQASETSRENIRLRQLVDWKQKVPWKLKLARVIARDPANWWRTVQIDRGTLDNVRENMPVLTPDGLIGRVSAVGMTSARVVLIGDPHCKVPATILGETAESGIITSAGLFDGSFVNLTYLANRAILKPGQSVVTSGLSAIYPEGIPIGTVADARSVESGLYTEAQVKLAANLNALQEVWVLFP